MRTSYTHNILVPVCFALHLLPSMTAVAAQPDVVGEVISVIGRGKVLGNAAEQAAERGQLIHAGDRIETEAGGHVHVRFVDGGLISVRPMSRLLIEDYQNSDAQRQAVIKFRLDDGVMRSVTGKWGEAHRDRFRLNTPIAAIGIKGTDFVVKANDASTQASVNSGAIVMAPLEGACAVSLGPCAGEHAAQLSADMQGKMLEYSKQNASSAPQLIPYVDLLASNSASNRVAASSTSNAQSSGTQSNGSQSSTVDLANKLTDTPIQALPVTNPDKELPVSQPMLWLHNSAGWNVPTNTISTRFDEASAAGRNIAMGNFFINLYRDETTTKEFTPPAESVSFNLSSASANYTKYFGASEPATISNAKLTVDFARSSLATQMNLSSPSMGQEQFSATATISPQGLFSNYTPSQQIAGAFSTDARQAGFLFEKKLENGAISGLTLWGK